MGKVWTKIWVDCVLAKDKQIPHPGEFPKGFRIFVPEAKLVFHNDGMIWKATIAPAGAQMADIFNGRVIQA